MRRLISVQPEMVALPEHTREAKLGTISPWNRMEGWQAVLTKVTMCWHHQTAQACQQSWKV